MPAAAARAEDLLPIGLAHGVALRRQVPAGTAVAAADVGLDQDDPVLQLRQAMRPAES
jgi:predicted homoserine dehydrogenase-like protein